MGDVAAAQDRPRMPSRRRVAAPSVRPGDGGNEPTLSRHGKKPTSEGYFFPGLITREP